MDDTYQAYVNRVARMTLPETYNTQVQHIQTSPKYQRQATGDFESAPFPGYSVITPPWGEESENQLVYEQLQACQQQLVQQLSPEMMIPVPPASFHMTLADLIWDSALRHASENPEFEAQLCERIAVSFQKCQPAVKQEPPVFWQVIGLIVMPRSIGVALAPKSENSYERVLMMRRAIYQNSSLIALGIEQQYHFTAHVTLGYFGNVTASTDRDQLSQVLNQLNLHWLESTTPQELKIQRAELRKFDDMTHYYRNSDWPVLEF